jgi:hypothetical protein
MYILTDYRLILTKDTKDKPDISSERADPSGTALARPVAIVNYRPVLSSERTLQNNKHQLSKRKSHGERKIGRGSGRNIFSTLAKFPHYTKMKKRIKIH